MLILAAGSAALGALWASTADEAEARTNKVFERELVRMARRLDGELRNSSLMLQGLGNLLRQAPELSPEAFAASVAQLPLGRVLPWVAGIGLLEAPVGGLPRGEPRAEGAQPVRLRAYLPSASAAGLPAGLLAQPALSAGLLKSALSGGPTFVTLQVQGGSEQSHRIWMLLPVYRSGGGASGAHSAAQGWVFAILDLQVIAAGLLEEESLRLHNRFAFELFDSALTGSGSRLLRFDPALLVGEGVSPRCHAVDVGGGHSWLLCGSPLPAYVESGFAARVAGFAAAWLVVLLLAALFWLQARARARVAAAHLALSGREAKLRAVFETSGAGIFSLDPDGVLVQANQRMAQMFGCAREALLGRRYAELVPEVGHPEIAARLAILAAGDVPDMDVERCYQRSDGSRFWGRVSARRLCDGEGNFAGLVAVILDIDDHRRAELRLQRSEARYRLLAETMHDVVWMLDVESQCLTYCSPSVERLTGVAATDLAGAPLARVLAPVSLPEVKASMRQHAARFLADEHAPPPASVSEVLCRRRDGSLVPVEVVSRLFRDPHSRRLVVVGVGRDISERLRLEAEQRIAAVAFEASTSLVVTDVSGKVMRVNRAFTALTGFEAAEMRGCSMNRVHSERQDAAFYAAMWAEIGRSGCWQGEVWNRHRDGHLYLVWLAITAVRDAAGRTTQYVGSAIDITQHFEQRSELRDLAFYDPLTGLANRRLFADRAEQAFAKSARNRQFGAVLCLDLDGFKHVNDFHGHAAGDKVLETVGQRLRAAVRDGDTVARLGGDEFVLLLEDLGEDRGEALHAAAAVAEKLCQALSEPYFWNGLFLHSPGSCGLAAFLGHEESVDAVLARADQALYAAKRAGRNTVRGEEKLIEPA